MCQLPFIILKKQTHSNEVDILNDKYYLTVYKMQIINVTTAGSE